MSRRKRRSIDRLYDALLQAEANIKAGKGKMLETSYFDLDAIKAFLRRALRKRKTTERDKMLDGIRTVEDVKSMLAGMTSKQLKDVIKFARKDKLDCMVQLVMIELAHREFWFYCQLRAPGFFKPNRAYLQELCEDLQSFVESDDRVCVINLPPRHGKSFTMSLFAQWLFGRDIHTKIMIGSYNKDLSTVFSKTVRNGIMEQKGAENIVVYSDIFPATKINRGDGSMSLWRLEGAPVSSYLATSPSGTATGFGASIIMVDDLIKNHKEAANEDLLDEQWSWFTDTMFSRLEAGGKILIVMTRWASGDLAGRAVEHFKSIGYPCRVIIKKAVQDDGTMLCEDVLSREDYDIKSQTTSPEIVSANYQQIPLDLKGRLYTAFKTYDTLDGIRFAGIYAYIDTADEGSDYLAGYVWGVYNHEAYILDVIYTQEGMEVTEPATAKMLTDNRVGEAIIESNNGGRGFARAVIKHLQNELHNYRTDVSWFHQGDNKKARIISNAFWVTQHVYFPVNWAHRWPQLHKDLNRYQRDGKNKHDDAPDALTGIAEVMEGLE